MRMHLDNALLVDGTGDAPRRGGLVIEDGRIAALTGPGEAARGDATVDLGGLALCPGFIDTHSHTDLAILDDPMPWPKLRQGVTTEIFGQDGISMAPLPAEHVGPWRRNLAGLEGVSESIGWDYATTDGYLDLLEERGVGVNVCYLAPHGNVRMEAMGLGQEVAGAAQLERMADVLRRELDAGAFGLSTGLIYPPCTYADRRELTTLCAVAAEYGRPLVIHQRSEADGVLESMAEVLDVARDSGVHVHFSHFKLCGKNNADKFPQMLRLLDEARAEGLDISFDQYPYVAGSTMLSAILPPWTHAGGTDALLERLAAPAERARILADIADVPSAWDNFVDFASVEGIFVTNVQTDANRDAIGKSLVELGEMRGKEPLVAALDIILEEANGVSMVDFYGLEEHVEALIARPEMNVCTDGLMHGKPHPRTYGAFARVLGKYSRERGLVPLEQAVYKMTGKPAATFAIPERGLLREGYHADLVAFDPALVRDTGDYTDPCRHPRGIELVMVNGRTAHAGEALARALPPSSAPAGRVLRAAR